MIAKVKSIAHGVNDLRYITGESSSKKHSEKIFNVKNNWLDYAVDASGIWENMKLGMVDHPRIKNNLIRIELSPAKNHTENFTREDWGLLWDDFIREFDEQELRDKKGKLISPKTNLKNSMATVWLHLDAKSGIPHLHGAVCRVDKDGHVNNDHQIHERAIRAAERVARKRGWATASKVREDNLSQIEKECKRILRSMRSWDLDEYFRLLQEKYDVKVRRDTKGVVRGYSIKSGNTIYKASEIGPIRGFTVPMLQRSYDIMGWRLFNVHEPPKSPNVEQRQEQKVAVRPTPPVDTIRETRSTPTPTPTPTEEPKQAPINDYSTYKEGTVSHYLRHRGRDYCFYIPQEIKDFLSDELDSDELENGKDLVDLAVAVFVGLLGTPEAQVSAGGGSTIGLPWRRKDDDDRDWARKCGRYAIFKLGRVQKRKNTQRRIGR